MAAIQGPKPEPHHKIDSGGNPASASTDVDGGSVGDGLKSEDLKQSSDQKREISAGDDGLKSEALKYGGIETGSGQA